MKKTIAMATMAAVALTAVGTEASAAATVKLVENKLVNAKTGKVVSGYKVYKSKLYKNGVLAKGKIVRGTGKNMKLYTNGVLKKGVVTTDNDKYLFLNGLLATGTKVNGYNDSPIRIYRDGVLKTTYTLSKDEKKVYKNGKLIKGYTLFEIPKWIDQNGTLKLFKDGKLVTSGTKVYTYDGVVPTTYDVKKGEKLLFKNGTLQKGTVKYDGIIYHHGFSRTLGTVLYDGKYYFNQQLANGDINSERYKDGELLGFVEDFNFLEKAEALKALKNELLADPTLIPEALTQVMSDLDTLSSYYNLYFEDNVNYRLALLAELDELAAVANDAALTAKIEEMKSNVYGSIGLGYENGALKDGVYDGILYTEGKHRGPVGSVYVREHERAFFEAGHEPVTAENIAAIQTVIEDHITLVIEALHQSIDHAKSGEHADDPSNYEIERFAVERTVSGADKFMKQAVNFDADLTTMQTGLQTIETLNAEYKTLRP